MDGTLADVNHRLHYIQGPEKKNWKRFFEGQVSDTPVDSIRERILQLAADHEIVIVTGRPELYRPGTEAWLHKYHIPYSRVFMRPHGDHRPDYVVKKEILDHIGADRVVMAFDDREPVCDMYRDAGIDVTQVTSDQANQRINEQYRREA